MGRGVASLAEHRGAIHGASSRGLLELQTPASYEFILALENLSQPCSYCHWKGRGVKTKLDDFSDPRSGNVYTDFASPSEIVIQLNFEI